MMGSLLGFFLVGLLAIVALGILLAIVGAIFSVALSLAGFLLFKVAPILLIGYLIVRFLSPKRHRAEDGEEWVEGA